MNYDIYNLNQGISDIKAGAKEINGEIENNDGQESDDNSHQVPRVSSMENHQ